MNTYKCPHCGATKNHDGFCKHGRASVTLQLQHFPRSSYTDISFVDTGLQITEYSTESIQ